jgi:TonB-linked SusC/RagA family outer membrane protein
MKRILQTCFLFLLVLSSIASNAQDKRITGKVTSKDDGLPLPGVSVLVTGTKIGTQTDINGNYTISVPASSKTLVFTFIGFSTQTVSIGTKTTINVALEVDAKSLSEVVVTGYGSQKKIEIGGSIAKVNGDQFENQPIVSFEKALQGRAAGVQVQANNGVPGGAINIQIRGVNSFSGGSQPLYIVDGVQLNGATFGGYTQTNTLAGINPNDIESIEVLKDAASSAIYGSQAANGVVIITTKKGKAGKTNFKVNAYTGLVEPLKFIDGLNTQEYVALRIEALQNSSPRNTLAQNRSTILQEIGQPTTLTDAEIAALPTYDWQDAVFRTGKVQNYEVSASGGNDKTQFYTSGAFSTQEATVTKVDFQRVAFKGSLDHKATDKLTISTNFNLANLIQKTPALGLDGSSLGSPAFSASLLPPAIPIYNADGSYNRTVLGILNQNIVLVNDYNSGDQKTNQLIGSVSATYKFTPELSFKTFGSVEYASITGQSYRDPRTPDGATFNGFGQVFNNQRSNIQTTQTLTYNKVFATKHKFNSFVGFEYRYDNSSTISAQGTNYPSFLFRNISAAGTPFGVNQTFTGYKQLSYLGSMQYNYDDKYIVKANFRYAGNSRFGSDNLFGFFPGVTFAWNLSEESFLKNVAWVNNVKLRTSYGQTGRDSGIGNFASRSLYNSGPVYANVSGIFPANLANPSLAWEKVTGLDLGLDFSLFKDRLSGSVGVFQNDNDDLLLDQPLLSTTGFTSIASNVGSIRAKGIEVELTTQNFNTKGGFKWSTSFNFTWTNNEITSLYDNLQILPSNVSLRVGSPLSSIYTFPYAGVNPATGRPLFTDVNDNYTYLPVPDDRRLVGQTAAPYFGGLTNNFSYKGFDADFLFQYQYGQKLQDGQENFLREVGRRQFNTYREAYDARWTTPGQLTHIPRAYAGNGTEPQGSGRVAGSNIFQYTDYIRLRSVQFGYTVPTKVLNKVKLSSLRVYMQGTNLITITKFDGYDPEFSATATGIVPQNKNYTFGIQLGF